MPTYDEALALLQEHRQEHILAGWDKLFLDQQEQLLADIQRVDFQWVAARRQELLTAGGQAPVLDGYEPGAVIELPKTDRERELFQEARELGEKALRQGKAAAFLVAGGQGTRLGFAGPKGSYPIGPISNRTLFQWHAERILARSRRYGAAIPWYIMTSRENDRDTKQFFEEKNFFGLPKNDVFFFQQDMVPCLDFDGKLMLASPYSLAMNPNGHGGSLSGLHTSGAIKDMRRRGIEYISTFQVDNPLVGICDPVFIGWHMKKNAEMSCKVLEKCLPSERIGVVCTQNGKALVVEYVDLPDDKQREMGPDGRLRFWAGSIAIHIINVDFAERCGALGLPWHQSRKKVAYFSGNRLVKPEKENAVKFETFIFDALPQAKATVNLEVKREHEFAPVKNAEGIDSVASCRQLLSNYFCEWLTDCGVLMPMPELSAGQASERPVVEISPLYALDSAELCGKIKPEGLSLERFLLLG